ncbi:MAG: terminase family protein [Bryobacteraceae bacterium]
MEWTAADEFEGEYDPTLDEVEWLYSPLLSQSKFHSSNARFKGFSGPVGSGKSAALCFEVVRLTYLNRGRQGLLAAPTYSMLRDATLVGLFRLLDDLRVDFVYRKTEGILAIESCGSSVLLRSLEEPERLRGTNLAWFGIDELSYAREEGWLRLEARLRDPKSKRLCGFGAWTPQGSDWVYSRFIHKPVAGYEAIRALPFENRYLLEKTPDYYERLESSYDPKFYQQEALGEYVNSKTDLVYDCFNRSVHLQKQTYDPQKTLLWALDFNVTPMSSVLAQYHDSQLRVIDEIVLERATTQEAATEFENRYGKHQGAVEIFGDASGRSMQTTGFSDYQILQNTLTRAGIRRIKMRVPASNPPVLSRIRKVNGLLTNALGEVRIEIAPKCEHLVKDLEEVLYKPGSAVIDKNRDPLRTHASDALGYLVWAIWGDKPQAGEMNKPLF